MATWVPTYAPNLWGHSSWECPSCSRAMYAVYPWNVTLMGLSASSGSLLVLRLNALFTPHAWTPRDLGFSLLITGVLSEIHLSWPNSVVWVTDVWCHIAFTLMPRTHQHILVINVWPLFDTLACVARETLPMPLVGPSLRGPPLLAVNDVRGLVSTQAPQSRAINLFSEETKSSPVATYVALCEGTWTVHRSDTSPYLI